MAESTLFGIAKGAASGVSPSPGLFVEADGGTLFLDEIHKLPPAMQPKCLRVLQEGIVRVVGGGERKIDVQIVSASSADLRTLVEGGAFAEDLYMRIAGAVVELPPLRERPDEVPYLIALESEGMRVHADYVEACLLRPWPGNVRELRAATKVAVVAARMAGSAWVRAGDLKPMAGQGFRRASVAPVVVERAKVGKEPDDPRWAVLRAEYAKHGNQKRAAETAGVPVATANRWLREAGLVGK